MHPEMRGTIAVRATSTSKPPPSAASEPSPKPSSAPPTTLGPTSGAAASSVAVRIADLAFAPATIRVSVGATVTWTNGDQAIHSVTATDAAWDSGILDPGASWSRRFTTAGTFSFVCSVHPSMQGQVVVGPSGSGSTTSPAAAPDQPPEPSASTSPAADVAARPSIDLSPTSSEPASTVTAVNSTREEASGLVRLALVGLVWVTAVGGLAAVVRGSVRRP
jgi:plastocyanin